MKNPLKAFLLIIFVSGCQDPDKQEEAEILLQTQIEEGMIVSKFYPNHVPKLVYQVNDQGLKEGYSISYNKEGGLASTTSWENGILEGNSYRFKNGVLTSHQINRQGNTWYEGIYIGQEKILNKLYPLFIEEFFFEDKYYAKIRFPLNHAGQMTVQVKDRGTPVIQRLDKSTFQLVINDALDLDDFILDLKYQPIPSDTLVPSRYSYTHQIYITE